MLLARIFPFFFIILFPNTAVLKENTKKLWPTLLEKNNFVLIRHSLAPGFGDPSYFKLTDCSTQRNLSNQGKIQSKKIGLIFKKNKIKKAYIYSSQWCRCLETANLMKLGEIKELPLLNSFFGKFNQRNTYINRLKNWLIKNNKKMPLVLVTHQVTITGLTGYFPNSGEIVFVNIGPKNNFKVYGTIKTD
ncbi:hypothetical protein OAK75_08100 [Bacteriovoracales bacterium]|nr:hypothetical protein [Bacteriovoracales bacterium]